MNSDNSENINDIIHNYTGLVYSDSIRRYVINLLTILDHIKVYDDIEGSLIDTILTDVDDDSEITKHEFDKKLIDVTIDKLAEYGVSFVENKASYRNLYNVFQTILNVMDYSELDYDSCINIMSDETNDEVYKLGQLITLYSNDETPEQAYEYIEDVTVNFYSTLINHLDKEKEKFEEIADSEEDIEFFVKVKDLDQALLETSVVKHLLTVKQYDYEYSELSNKVYGLLNLENYSKFHLELSAWLLLANNVENNLYFIDSEIRDDLEELDIDMRIINEIVMNTKEYIGKVSNG